MGASPVRSVPSSTEIAQAVRLGQEVGGSEMCVLAGVGTGAVK